MSLLKSLLLSLMALAGAATAAHAVDTTIDFSPSSVGPNQTSRMTISFTNPLGSPITDLSLVKDLPGIFIANPDQATTTCAGAKVTLTNTDTGGQVAIANAEVPINTTNSGVCTVAFDTTTKTRGARIVTIRAGEVVATQNGGPTTNPQDGSGTLSTVFLNPTVTLSSPHGSHTSAGEVAIIHLTITNPNTTAMTGVGVSLSPSTLFPSHGALLGVVPGTLEGSTCAITGSADPTQGVSFSNLTVPASGVCRVVFSVQGLRDPKQTRSSDSVFITLPVNSVHSNEGVSNDVSRTYPFTISSGIAVFKTMNNTGTSAQNVTERPDIPITITLENMNTFPTGVGTLTDPLPNNMTFSSLVDNTCGGTVTGEGTRFITWNGALEAAPALNRHATEIYKCTITANARVTGAGTYVNTIPAGTIDGYAFNMTYATLNASAGALSPSMTARALTGSNFAYWGDVIAVTLRLREVTGTTDIQSVRAPFNIYPNGFKFLNIASNSCSNGSTEVIAGSGKTSDRVTYVGGPLGRGEECEVVLHYQTLPDTTTSFRINTPTLAISANTLTYQVNGTTHTHTATVSGGLSYLDTPFQTTTAFTPNSVGAGGISRMRITTTHYSLDRNTVSGLTLTANLPGGLRVSDRIATNAIVNTCGGTVTAEPNDTSFSLAGGAITGTTVTKNCYIDVPVLTPALPEGQTQASTSYVLPVQALEGTTSFGAEVDSPNLPPANRDGYNGRNNAGSLTWSPRTITLSKSFSQTVVDGGVPSRISVTISNVGNNLIRLTGVELIDDMSATDLRVAQNPQPTLTGCTGTMQAVRDAVTASITNTTINVGATCVFSFNVYSPTGGNHTNTIPAGALFSNEAVTNAQAASATLTVLRNLNLDTQFSVPFAFEDDRVQLTYTLLNTNTEAAMGSEEGFVANLPVGMTLEGPTTTTTCPAMDLNTTPSKLTASGGWIPAGGTCTITTTVSGAPGYYTATTAPASMDFTVQGVATSNTQASTANLSIGALPVLTTSLLNSAGQPQTVFTVGDTGMLRATFTNPSARVNLFQLRTNLVQSQSFGERVRIDSSEHSCVAASVDPAADGRRLNPKYIPAQTTCTITSHFTAIASGAFSETSSPVTIEAVDYEGGYYSVQNRSAPAVTTVAGEVVDPLTTTLAFGDERIVAWSTTTATLTLTNPNGLAADVPSFSALLPTSLVYVPNSLNACAALPTTITGQNLVVDGGSLPANSSCTITFEVQAIEAGHAHLEIDVPTSDGETTHVKDTVMVDEAIVAYTVDKEANVTEVAVVDSPVSWTITLHNEGNVDLPIVAITDVLERANGDETLTLTGSLDPLLVDEIRTLTAETVVDQTLFNTQSVLRNTVEVNTLHPDGQTIVSQEADAEVAIVHTHTMDASLNLDASSLPAFAEVGDLFTWSGTFTNTGNTATHVPSLATSRPNQAIVLNNGDGVPTPMFEPGQTYSFAITDVLTADDIEAQTLAQTLTITTSSPFVANVETEVSQTGTFVANTAPDANDDTSAPSTPGSVVVLDALANDTDSTGALDPTSLMLVGGSNDGRTLVVLGEGTWQADAAGLVTFTPEEGVYMAPEPVAYTVADTRGRRSQEATLRVTLSAIVAPVANDDTTNNLPTNAIASIPVLDNDTLGTLPLDPDSLLIEGMASFTVDGEGTWSQGTGAITFQPVAGFTANPTAVRYTVSDVAGTPSNTATITLTFTPRPPVAHDDIRTDRTTAQPVTVNVLANDQDPDGTLDPTSLRVENAPGDGTALSVEGEGTWTTTAEGTIIFTPAPGFTADPTPIAYTVADNDNNRSTAASVVLTFTARPPLALADTLTNLPTNTPAAVTVLNNDSDPDGTLDPTSVQLVNATPDTRRLDADGEGTWTVEADGSIVFTPTPGFTANPTPIAYTVADNDNNRSQPAIVTLNFNATLPTAMPDVVPDQTTTTTITVAVLDNDSDADGSLDVASVRLEGAGGDGRTLTIADEGTWTVALDGVITFTPVSGFTANPTPVAYTVADNDGNRSQPATITLIFTARPPVASDDLLTDQTTTTVVTVAVLDNDADADGNLDVASVRLEGAGGDGRTLTIADEGTWTVTLDGTIAFTPVSGFTANPTPVAYTVADNDGNRSQPATITLIFTARPPVASDDLLTDQTTTTVVTVAVLDNDADADGNLDVASVRLEGAGGDGRTLTIADEGTWTVTLDGAITFTPASGFTANPTPVAYTVADNDGNRSQPATITLLFAARAPIARDDVGIDHTTTQPVSVTVLDNDEDQDGILDVASVRLEGADGDGRTLTIANEGTWTVTLDGAITFTPASGFTANPTPVSYTVADNDGNRSQPATITITFAVQRPIASDDTLQGLPTAAPVTLAVLDNDSDPDGALAIDSVRLDNTGTPSTTLTVPGEGVWTVSADAILTFTPHVGFTANPTPITYTVADNDGNRSDPATVILLFTARGPLAQDDARTDLPIGQTVVVPVLANDSDPDGVITTHSVRLEGTAQEGASLVVADEGTWSVDADGQVRFAPLDGLTADPTPIGYTVADNDGNRSNVATITITFSTPAPLAKDDAQQDLAYGHTASLAVLANDEAYTSTLDPTTVRLVSTSGDGTQLAVEGEGNWRVEPNGTITFTPQDGAVGSPTPVGYTVANTQGVVSNVARVTLSYLPAEAPNTQPDTARGPRPGVAVAINVLTNDGDTATLDTNSLRLEGTDTNTLVVAGQGTWEVQPSGRIRFTPADGFYGDPDPVRYTVSTTAGVRSAPTTVTITYDREAAMESRVSLVVEDINTNGVNDPGDRVRVRFFVRNTGNIPLIGAHPVQADRLPNLACTPVDVAVGQELEITCTNAIFTITTADAHNGTLDIVARFLAESLDGSVATRSDADAITVAMPPVAAPLDVSVRKTATTNSAITQGQNVPYLIEVTNNDADNAAVVDVIDRLPAGLIYVEATATIANSRTRVERNANDLVFDNVTLAPGATVRITLQATVVDFDAGVNNVALVTDGQDRNVVLASSQANIEEDRQGVAVFDCAVVLGRIFVDSNSSGVMETGEQGVAGVRVITARGLSITSDAHGRFSVPCPHLPSDVGTNMVLKLDPATLPQGHTLASSNPLIVRLTAGKAVHAAFALQATTARQEAQVAITAQAFTNGEPSAALRAAFAQATQAAGLDGVHFVIIYNRSAGESQQAAERHAQALYRSLRAIPGATASIAVHPY